MGAVKDSACRGIGRDEEAITVFVISGLSRVNGTSSTPIRIIRPLHNCCYICWGWEMKD